MPFPRRRQQFTSKTQGMNTRKHRWLCHDCSGEWTVRQKQRKCPHCGCKSFAYFPSELEFGRYRQLQLYLRIGQISNLTLQPSFPVKVNDILVCTYKADFQYQQDGVTIIEDCKGLVTDLFDLKKKLVEAMYGITITIVKKI